jgi:hypothetical protein
MASTAADRGWGPGWPTDNRKKCGWAEGGGVRLLVRAEIVELVSILLAETARRGYQLDAVADDWGYASRPIRGTSTPSNHSWGLAIDLNASSNPMGADTRDRHARMDGRHVDRRVGSGGAAPTSGRKDAMHYEYMGRPTDVARDTTTARRLAGQPSITTGDEMSAAEVAQITTAIGALGVQVEDLRKRIDGIAPKTLVDTGGRAARVDGTASVSLTADQVALDRFLGGGAMGWVIDGLDPAFFEQLVASRPSAGGPVAGLADAIVERLGEIQAAPLADAIADALARRLAS